MPDDKGTGVDLDQYQKEKKEFSDAIDEVFAEETKTDDEIIKSMDDKQTDKDTNAASGDATKDSDTDPAAAVDSNKDKTDDLFTTGQEQGVAADESAAAAAATDGTDSGETDWQKKAKDAEAELQKERQKTASWNGRITKANQRALDLEAEIEKLKTDQPAKDIDSKSDNEVLDRFRSDFPELADVVDVLQKRIDGNTPAQAKEPVPAAAPTDSEPQTTTHMEDIRKVHKDLDEMVNSGVLLTWINNQADFMKPHLESIYRTGNTQQVIDMVSRFKETSGWKSQLEQHGDNKNKSKQEKLDALKEVNSEGGGPPANGPDKNDFDGAAKEAGL